MTGRFRHGGADRLLGVVTRVEPGEAGTVLLLMLNLFLLLTAYYILKTVREPLILVGGGAELKSYAAAVQALLLLAVVPLYSALVNRVGRVRLINRVTLFFWANILVFYGLARLDAPYLGVLFFIWVGIFSLMVIAQLWSFANDLYTPQQGKRLFALIGVGSSLGAIAGAWFAGRLLELGLGVQAMMLVAAGLLLVCAALTAIVQRREKGRIAARAAARTGTDGPPDDGRSGFALVLRDRYLLLIAVLILLLNVVNTTGEFILGRTVREAALAALPGGGEAELNAFVGGFYADFFTVVNILGAALQMLAVSRIMARLQIAGSLLVLPVIALVGYSLLAAAPALLLVRVVKTLENATDYSLQNTLRHALFLPTSAEAKYKAKQAIDTFCVRLGDVASAGVVFAGTTLGLATAGFALVNVGLVLVWLGLAVAIGRRYARRTAAGAVLAFCLVLALPAGPAAAAGAPAPTAPDSLATLEPVDGPPAQEAHPGPVPLTVLRGTDRLPGRGGTLLQRAGHHALTPAYWALHLAMLPLETIAELEDRHRLSTLLSRLLVWQVDLVETDFTVTFGYDSHLGLSAFGLRTGARDWLGSGFDLQAEAAFLTPAENRLLAAWSRGGEPLRLTVSGSLAHEWKVPFYGLGPDAPPRRSRTDRRLAVADVELAWRLPAAGTVSAGAYTRRQSLAAPSHGRPVSALHPALWERARVARYAGLEGAWQLDTRPDGGFSRSGVLVRVEGGLHRALADGDADYRHHGARAASHVDLRHGRVLVLQGWYEGVEAQTPQAVPWTELPALGGRRTLRGYRPNRFTDRHALVLGAEYGWPLLGSVQARLFCDWGAVAPSRRLLRPAGIDPALGLGLVGRLRDGRGVMLQVARSPEGWRLYVGSGASFDPTQRRRR